MFTRIMCDGVKVGLRFISDCKTDNNKSVKSFEMKMPYFDEMHYNDKNFVNQFITAKNKMLFDDTVKHDSTENFYRLLKRYSHGKSYLTVEEFSRLVKAIGYSGYYYSYDVISCFEEVKICNKSIRVTDSTGRKTYLRIDGNYKLPISSFSLIHHDSNNRNDIYKYC